MQEVLLSSLDAQEAARKAGSSMLVYLTGLAVQCAQNEMDDLGRARERIVAPGPANGAAP